MKKFAIHNRISVLLVLVVGFLNLPALAHLPTYEGERVRNGNHFTKQGFAEPVRASCPVNGAIFSPQLGSANIYLGGDNSPADFFCRFAYQDDWSFENPIDLVESTRTPAPNPETLDLPLQEGYIPCSVQSDNAMQCPRLVKNIVTAETRAMPGKCVDIGKPRQLGESFPDGKYHCALLPGAPRPRTSTAVLSTLTGVDDVDWAIYRYKPVYGQQPIVAAAQIPACKKYLETYVNIAYAGPLGLKDARTGKDLFSSPAEIANLPEEIIMKIPEGYGLRVKRPQGEPKPTATRKRLGYASGFSQNGWFLAPSSVVSCVDDFEACVADNTGELSKHYKYNDIFFVDSDTPIDFYLMWWVDHDEETPKQTLTDVSIITGVIDQIIVGDTINVARQANLFGNGRTIHGKCLDPRPTGLVDMKIESIGR